MENYLKFVINGLNENINISLSTGDIVIHMY